MPRFFLARWPWRQETSTLVLRYLLLASPCRLELQKTTSSNLQLRKPTEKNDGVEALFSSSPTGWSFGVQSVETCCSPSKEVRSHTVPPLAIFRQSRILQAVLVSRIALPEGAWKSSCKRLVLQLQGNHFRHSEDAGEIQTAKTNLGHLWVCFFL